MSSLTSGRSMQLASASQNVALKVQDFPMQRYNQPCIQQTQECTDCLGVANAELAICMIYEAHATHATSVTLWPVAVPKVLLKRKKLCIKDHKTHVQLIKRIWALCDLYATSFSRAISSISNALNFFESLTCSPVLICVFSSCSGSWDWQDRAPTWQQNLWRHPGWLESSRKLWTSRRYMIQTSMNIWEVFLPSSCSRSFWFRSSAIFVHRFTFQVHGLKAAFPMTFVGRSGAEKDTASSRSSLLTSASTLASSACCLDKYFQFCSSWKTTKPEQWLVLRKRNTRKKTTRKNRRRKQHHREQEQEQKNQNGRWIQMITQSRYVTVVAFNESFLQLASPATEVSGNLSSEVRVIDHVQLSTFFILRLLLLLIATPNSTNGFCLCNKLFPQKNQS